MSITALKYIAMATMLIDHIGMVEGNIKLFRFIGRIAFVLYAYMVVEGWMNTKDRQRYFSKLLLLAFISEIPFNMLSNHGSLSNIQGQNVIWIYVLGTIGMFLEEKIPNNFLKFIPWVVLGVIADKGSVDYGYSGVALMFLFSNAKKGDPLWKFLFYGLIFVLLCILRTSHPIANILHPIRSNIWICGGAFLGFIIVYVYNKTKLYHKSSRLFNVVYWLFYPLHLLVLSVIKIVKIFSNSHIL